MNEETKVSEKVTEEASDQKSSLEEQNNPPEKANVSPAIGTEEATTQPSPPEDQSQEPEEKKSLESSPEEFFEAIKRNALDEVVSFLEKKSLLSALDTEGHTPLMAAAAAGHLDLVKLFVECGASLESKGKDGRTALMHALSNGHLAIAEYLLSKGANVNIASVTNYTPLMQAAAKGAVTVVRMILPRVDNVNARDMEGRTALMIAARFGHREIIDILLNRGASLLITDNKGNTAISYAETPELKQYLAQKAEEERKAVEKRAKKEEKKEEAPVEEEIKEAVKEAKKRAPSLILVTLLFLLSCAGLYFAYYQLKSLKPREISLSSFHQEGGAALAIVYCTRLTACRENASPGFAERCVEQSKHRFALFLAEQGGSMCNDTRLKTCNGCLEGLACDRILALDFSDLKRTCSSCLKICEQSQ